MDPTVGIPRIQSISIGYSGGCSFSVDIEAQAMSLIHRRIIEQGILSADHFRCVYTIKTTVTKYVLGSPSQPPAVEAADCD